MLDWTMDTRVGDSGYWLVCAGVQAKTADNTKLPEVYSAAFLSAS